MKKLFLIGAMVIAGTILSGCGSQNNTGTDTDFGTQSADLEERRKLIDGEIKKEENADRAADTAEPANVAEVADTGTSPVAVTASAVATCLSDAGRQMAGAEWCQYCEDQKDAFGSDFPDGVYIDCDVDISACQNAGVQGYPTWISPDGNLHPGLMTLEALSALACS